MIALSREAEAHLDELIEHFDTDGRLEADINFLRAVERASPPVISGVFYITSDILRRR